MTRTERYAVAATSLLIVAGCGSPEPPPQALDANRFAPRADRFSAESSWQHMRRLVEMGPRTWGHPGYEAVQEYLREHLEISGASVRSHSFQHQFSNESAPRPFTNIIASFAGSSSRWILLGTHYDTRAWADQDPSPDNHDQPIVGANDGASGVAVLLEIASVLSERPPSMGVVLAFFDGEEGRRGGGEYSVGSKQLAARFDELFASRPVAAIVIDMVGDADLRILHDPRSAAANPWLDVHLWRQARELGLDVFDDRERGYPLLDDHGPLLDIGIPATLVIDYDYPWWHTVSDTLDKCSRQSLEVTGRVLLRSVLDRPPGPAVDAPREPR